MQHWTRFLALSGALAAAVVMTTPARANIYGFTDERGVTHFTNIPTLDKRYRLVYRYTPDAKNPPRSMAAPRPQDQAKYASIIENAARYHGLEPALVHAVISAESGYNAQAVSPKGATGLMQLMPATGQRYGVANLFDPTENIFGGTKYLRDLLVMFGGNLELAVAAYNAGENAVIRAGHRIPNYAETVAYVPKVMEYYRRYRQQAGVRS